MIETYIAELPLSDKRYLKRRLENRFADGQIDLNTMGFIYDSDRDMVIVEGLIEGDEIDGLEFQLSDFMIMVNEVLAGVVVYHTEEEKATALRTYLTDLPFNDQQTLKHRLPKLTTRGDIDLPTLQCLYDEERGVVVVNVLADGVHADRIALSLGNFLAVVKEVIGDVKVAR